MFKNAYFLAAEALAGLLCDARIEHAYRPLAQKVDGVEANDSGEIECHPIALSIPQNLGRDRVETGGGHSVVPAFDKQVEHDDCGGADQRDSAKADECEVEEGHSSPCSCGGGSAQRVEPVQLALFGLRHADQSLPYGEARIGDTPLGKLVDGGLLTPALDRHLQLSDAVRFEVSDDLLPVHTHENNCIQLLRQAVFS